MRLITHSEMELMLMNEKPTSELWEDFKEAASALLYRLEDRMTAFEAKFKWVDASRIDALERDLTSLEARFVTMEGKRKEPHGKIV